MKCPLRFSRYISEKDEECVLDCAWRLVDLNNATSCAIAAQAATACDALLLNYEKLVAPDEEEDTDGE